MVLQNQFIADAVDRLDESWVLGIGFDLGAERGDVIIDGAGGGKSGVTPDGVEEAFTWDRLAGVFDEEAEHREFLGREMDRRGIAEGSLGEEIDMELTELEFGRS